MTTANSQNQDKALALSGNPQGDAPAGDARRAARIGLLALGIGFGGFLLWAGFAPLDEGVPTQGMVTIDTKRKAVQHLSGGIVQEVLVREGQMVQEGDVVLRLDANLARANLEQVRQRYLGLRAMEARLIAEQSGAKQLPFHPDLLAEKDQPEIRRHMVTQEQLLLSRRAALQADLASFEESIRGQEALVRSYQSMLPNRREQLKLLSEELQQIRALVKDGYAPRTRQMELERAVADSNNAIARQQEYRKEVDTQMADVAREVQAEEQRYIAAKADLERIDIKATATGQVVGLAVQTVGGVITPGQKLMDIVPGDLPLLLEAQIPPHLIDKVHTGMLADVRFNTFSSAPQLVVEGKVMSISQDLLSDPANPQIMYYLARIEVTPQGMKTLGKHQLQPGMPVETVIKTGERSMLTYLLHPLTKRIAASLTED